MSHSKEIGERFLADPTDPLVKYDVELPLYSFVDDSGKKYIIRYSKDTIYTDSIGKGKIKYIGSIPERIVIKYNPNNPQYEWYALTFDKKYLK